MHLSSRDPLAYKCVGNVGGYLRPESVVASYSPQVPYDCHRQCLSQSLHQQTGGHSLVNVDEHDSLSESTGRSVQVFSPSILSTNLLADSHSTETPHIDLFVTLRNYRLQVYVIPVPNPSAQALDTLSIPWDDMISYTVPLIKLIPYGLAKLLLHWCVLYLLAPNWPTQTWYPLFLYLLECKPLILPLWPNLLAQPISSHRNISALSLHMWKLSVHPFCYKRHLSICQILDGSLVRLTLEPLLPVATTATALLRLSSQSQ